MAIELGIDLGTSSVLVYIKGKGVVLKEPTVVAFDRETNEVKAIGEEARIMLERTPGSTLTALYPMRQGVIADYTVTEKMIHYFVQKAIGRRLFKPVMNICVSNAASEVERKAVESVGYVAGARMVYLVDKTVAAAIGAGIDITRPCGNMIVDVGGGTTDVAIISMGGMVVDTSIKVAGNDFDEALMRYVRKTHNLLISPSTAEDIKIKIGTVYPQDETQTMEINGRDLKSGLPRKVRIASAETEEVFREVAAQIIEAIISVLEQTPPEIAGDILDRGIILTGGGSLLRGLGEMIEDKTGITTTTTEQPMRAVAIGTGRFREIMDERNAF